MAVTVWKDNKDIYLISNVYPVSGDETVPRKWKADGVVEQVPWFSCPAGILEVNGWGGPE